MNYCNDFHVRIVLIDEDGAPSGASQTLVHILSQAFDNEGQDGDTASVLSSLLPNIQYLKGTAADIPFDRSISLGTFYLIEW